MRIVRGLAAVLVLLPCSACGLDTADGAAGAAAAQTSSHARASSAKEWLGSDPGAFADGLIAQLRAFERPVEDDEKALGTTWDAELARARARFVAARTTDDVYYALLALGATTHDPHSHFGPRGIPDALVPKSAPVALDGLSSRAEYDESGAVHYALMGDGVPDGSVVVAVDGVPIDQVEKSFLDFYGMHEPHGLHATVAIGLVFRDPTRNPAPASGTSTSIEVKAASGESSTVKRDWKTIQQRENLTADERDEEQAPPCCEQFNDGEAETDYGERTPVASGQNWCTYTASQPDVVIARACSFDYQDQDAVKRDQAALLEALQSSGASKVLFDVRENGGGTFDPAFFGNFATKEYRIPMKRFYFGPGFRSDPAQIGKADLFLEVDDPADVLTRDMQAHPDAKYSKAYPFFCTSPSCNESEGTFPAVEGGSQFRVAVLTGPLCVSACDDFVSIMKDNEIATLVGVPTASGDAPFHYALPLRLANGKSFDLTLTVGDSLRPGTNTILEGHPPAIDVPLLPSADNRGHYLDAVIEAAKF